MLKTLALLLLLLAKPVRQSPDNFSVLAKDWATYVGTPDNVPGAAQVNFPVLDGTPYNSLNYYVTPHAGTISGSLSTTFTLTNTGAPVYVYSFPWESNPCVFPAHVRLWFARTGWEKGSRPSYRWWSNPSAYTLVAAGNTVTLTVALNPALWSDVNGQFGNAIPSDFAAALNDVSSIGFSFGGGCFFGHGVAVQAGTGTSTFTVNEYKVVR
jgi:hypothetical protein